MYSARRSPVMRRTGRKKGNRNASESEFLLAILKEESAAIEDGTQVENGGGGGGAAQVKGAARRNARELQATPCYRDFLREFCLNSNKARLLPSFLLCRRESKHSLHNSTNFEPPRRASAIARRRRSTRIPPRIDTRVR